MDRLKIEMSTRSRGTSPRRNPCQVASCDLLLLQFLSLTSQSDILLQKKFLLTKFGVDARYDTGTEGYISHTPPFNVHIKPEGPTVDY